MHCEIVDYQQHKMYITRPTLKQCYWIKCCTPPKKIPFNTLITWNKNQSKIHHRIQNSLRPYVTFASHILPKIHTNRNETESDRKCRTENVIHVQTEVQRRNNLQGGGTRGAPIFLGVSKNGLNVWCTISFSSGGSQASAGGHVHPPPPPVVTPLTE